MTRALFKPAPVTLAIFLLTAIPAVLLHDPQSRFSLMLALLAIMVPGLLLVLYTHELGHVVGGLACGYRFIALICGPFAFARVGDRLKAELNGIWALYGGIAMLAPRGGTLPPTREVVTLFAAGPLASLLLGALFLAVHFGAGLDDVTRRTILAGTHTVGQLLAGGFTLIVGVCSLAIAFVTMVPNAVGGYTSDGAAIRLLLRGGADAERLQAIGALTGRMAEGARPRDWEVELVRRAVAVEDGSALESGASSMALMHALDRGDLAQARTCLARMLAAAAKAPAIGQGELRLAEAWIAVADRRLDEARAAWAQSEGAIIEEYGRRRVLAAILIAEGQMEAGAQTAREGLQLLVEGETPFAGLALMEQEWLQVLADGRLPDVLAPATASRT